MKTVLSIAALLIFTLSVSAQKIIDTKILSTKMKKDIRTIIITPDLEKGKRYQTVYILHGYSGNAERTYKQDIPDLLQKARLYQTIYILPDGHFNSWYVDSPVDSSSQYQTFIGNELVAFIDAHYPTIKDRRFRGILGWSMGGYGALNIGIAYQNIFAIVGSSCGALDFNGFGPGYQAYQVDKVLGGLDKLPKQYFTFNKTDQMQTARQYYILDCGTEDQLMIGMNRDFHLRLTAKKISHQYTESPGGHDTAYWSKALSNQLALFQHHFTDQQ